MSGKSSARLSLKGPLGKFLVVDMVDSKTKRELGSTTVSGMLEMISKGQSPVRGYGRFVGYAADRKAESAKAGANSVTSPKIARKIASSIRGSSKYYPNSVLSKYPGKKRRPVNLSLNGKFLSTIKWQGTKNGVEVGHIDADKKTKDLFAAHNEGENTRMKVPQRKYLPGRGEEFVISIMRKIREIMSLRIKELIRDG